MERVLQTLMIVDLYGTAPRSLHGTYDQFTDFKRDLKETLRTLCTYDHPLRTLFMEWHPGVPVIGEGVTV